MDCALRGRPHLLHEVSLDLVYIDKKNLVRKVVRDVRPWRVSFCLMADSIVELPVGVIGESATQKGDEMVFERIAETAVS